MNAVERILVAIISYILGLGITLLITIPLVGYNHLTPGFWIILITVGCVFVLSKGLDNGRT